jgi:hypothetical protein
LSLAIDAVAEAKLGENLLRRLAVLDSAKLSFENVDFVPDVGREAGPARGDAGPSILRIRA